MKYPFAILLLIIFTSLISVLHAGPADELSVPEMSPHQDDFRRWALVPTYSYSFFNKGRQSWQEQDTQILYQLNSQWSLGAETDVRDRPPSGTDVYYSGLASYSPLDALELHAKISVCPDPSFSANEVYSGGFQYQVIPELGLLLDYEGFNFDQGSINEIKPGVTIGITDDLSLALRYVHGWAFSTLEYDYYSGALNIGLPEGRRLSLSFAYGTDPETDLGSGGNTVNSLSPAYVSSIFFRQPFGKDLNVFAGIEYVYRLNQNGDELYQQLTPTIGLAWKF